MTLNRPNEYDDDDEGAVNILAEDTYFGLEIVDLQTRRYHSRVRLLEDWQIQGGLAGANFLSNGQPLCAVLEFLLNIPGVTEAQVRAYHFTVTKSPIFSWDSIQGQIGSILLGIRTAVTETTELEKNWREILKLRDLVDPAA